MESVDSTFYDKNYFEHSIATTLELIRAGNSRIHNAILDMFAPDQNETVVDFGCGTGILSFFLHQKYKCRVIGIDYSADAIEMCNTYNQQLGYKGVSFVRSDIASLPILKGVKAVYMSDVIEHLYDPEIECLFGKFDQWGKASEAEPREFNVIIHTDNTLYLNFVRPIIDAVNLLSRNVSLAQLRQRNKFERERHVNLTSAKKLTKKMKGYGYSLLKIAYPSISEQALKSQLGFAGKFKMTRLAVQTLYPWIARLSPSFYSLYWKTY